MPTSDPAKKEAQRKKWLTKNIRAGYGKWLYAKRKVRYTDAEEFEKTLEIILSDSTTTLNAARLIASRALANSKKRHDAIREWRETVTLQVLALEEEERS